MVNVFIATMCITDSIVVKMLLSASWKLNAAINVHIVKLLNNKKSN